MSCIGGGAQTAEDKAASRNSKNIERLLKREKSAYLNTQRLLLLGRRVSVLCLARDGRGDRSVLAFALNLVDLECSHGFY